jgi:hypothetical protein
VTRDAEDTGRPWAVVKGFYVGQRVRLRTASSDDPEVRAVNGRSGIVDSISMYTDDPSEDPEAEGPFLGVWIRGKPGRNGREFWVFRESGEVEPR